MLADTYYHGTTQRFRRFDTSKSYYDCALGPAVYLTDCPRDATELYGCDESPDLQQRISVESDKIYHDAQPPIDWATARKRAEQIWLGKHWRLLHVRPLVKNVAIVAKERDNRETRIQLWTYDENDELIETPEFQTIHNFLSRYLEPNQINFEDRETTFREIGNMLAYGDVYDEPGQSPGGLCAKLMQKLGYDAALMIETEKWWSFYYRRGINSNHLVVFDPSKVKIVKREKLK